MNVTFTLPDEGYETAFHKLCTDKGCVGVKGHRSVGGFRASIYNALSLESAGVFASCMREFADKNG